MDWVNPCENGLVVVPMHCANGVSGSDDGEEPVPPIAPSAPLSRTSELTISFEGEVYVFPAVTPEKVPFFIL